MLAHTRFALLLSCFVAACSGGTDDPMGAPDAAVDATVSSDAGLQLTMFPVAGETARAPVILSAGFRCISGGDGLLDVTMTITVDDDEGKANVDFVSGGFTGADKSIDLDGWSYNRRVADWYHSVSFVGNNPAKAVWGPLCSRSAIKLHVRTLDMDAYANDNDIVIPVDDAR